MIHVDEWPPCFDSESEGHEAARFNLSSVAFVSLVSFLLAAQALAFSTASKYTLGRWHNALQDPRSPAFLGACSIQQIARTVSAASTGLTAQGLHIMQSIGVPAHCLRIMAAVWDRIKEVQGACTDLRCAEYFCGEGAVHKAMAAHGSRVGRTRKRKDNKAPVRGFDIRHDPVYQDLNTDFGFFTALCWLLRLADYESLAWFGTVCSSWIWMARGTTRRTFRSPRGNLRAQSVQAGNQMLARTAFLICVCYAKAVDWVLEQPLRSLMSAHPSLVWVGKRARREAGLPWWSVQTFMGCFNGHTVKPHELFGCGAWLASMRRSHPGRIDSSGMDITRTFIDKHGKKRCSGGKGLKDTQTYPAVAISSVLSFRAHLKLWYALP